VPVVNNAIPDETFLHLFFDCHVVKNVLANFFQKYLPEWSGHDDLMKKKFLFTGINLYTEKRDNFFATSLAIIMLFYIWECKLQKKIPTLDGMTNEVFYTLENIRRASTTCQLAMIINLAICRDWKAETDRRQ
jgi:hypothetical protein